MVAVVAEGDGVSDGGACFQPAGGASPWRRWRWCRHAGWKPAPQGALAARSNAAWPVGNA